MYPKFALKSMETVQLIILIIGVGLGFFVQTVAGFAGGLFALPIILQAFPMQEAVAYLSIFLCIFSILLVYKTWPQIDKDTIKEFATFIVYSAFFYSGALFRKPNLREDQRTSLQKYIVYSFGGFRNFSDRALNLDSPS